MQVLADNGGYVLAEAGARLLFFKRRIIPTWTVYVPGLLTVIATANAVIQAVIGNLAAAGVIFVAGALCAACLQAARHSRRRARAKPLVATDALVQLDLEGRRLLEGDGRVLSTLDQVRVEKTMQLTSSARALTIVWPGGRRVVYRGDPLAPNGSIADAAGALKARGVPTTW
jgi:hypothetical protein